MKLEYSKDCVDGRGRHQQGDPVTDGNARYRAGLVAGDLARPVKPRRAIKPAAKPSTGAKP